MAITIPDRKEIRLTTDNTAPNNGQQLATCLASADMVNPGPVKPSTTQNNPAGNVIVEACAGASVAGYLGYNVKPNVKAGEPCGVFRGVMVDGFLGVVAGSDVYADTTGADAAATASGLTHTANGQRIGVGATATKIRFD